MTEGLLYFFYVHGTVHLSNTSYIKYQREPWNIIHTANNSYTGFILPRTYDTHQWLPVQFVNYSWWWTQTAPETCRVIINQINRKSCISLVFYKTRVTVVSHIRADDMSTAYSMHWRWYAEYRIIFCRKKKELEYPGAERRQIISKFISNITVKFVTSFTWLRTWTVGELTTY